MVRVLDEQQPGLDGRRPVVPAGGQGLGVLQVEPDVLVPEVQLPAQQGQVVVRPGPGGGRPEQHPLPPQPAGPGVGAARQHRHGDRRDHQNDLVHAHDHDGPRLADLPDQPEDPGAQRLVHDEEARDQEDAERGGDQDQGRQDAGHLPPPPPPGVGPVEDRQPADRDDSGHRVGHHQVHPEPHRHPQIIPPEAAPQGLVERLPAGPEPAGRAGGRGGRQHRLAVPGVPQLAEQLAGRPEPLRLRPVEQSQDHPLQGRVGRPAGHLARRLRGGELDLPGQVGDRGAGERVGAGQHPVGDHPQGPQVRLRAGPPAELLGGHEQDRPGHPLFGPDALVAGADAEVREHVTRPPGGAVHQDVGRLDVPVDDAVGVGLGQGPAELDEQVVDGLRREPLGVPEDRLEVLAGDQLHGDRHPRLLVDEVVEHPDDARVIEPGDQGRFEHQPVDAPARPRPP